jgi:hypothetical protein
LDQYKPHVFCPIHGQAAIGNFALPLQQNILTKALTSHYLNETAGYSAYSTRRATSCALAQLVHVEEGRHMKSLLDDYPSCKARVNAQFGWCPKSNMLMHYCKGNFPLTLREKAFYYPLYMFVRYGLTQDRIEKSFVYNKEGDTLPAPVQSGTGDPVIGPNTKSSEVDTKSVLMHRIKGKRVPLIGETAVLATSRSSAAENKSKEPIEVAHAGQVVPAKKRGRKKGGTNRSKEAIAAAKEAKSKKNGGRPVKGE